MSEAACLARCFCLRCRVAPTGPRAPLLRAWHRPRPWPACRSGGRDPHPLGPLRPGVQYTSRPGTAVTADVPPPPPPPISAPPAQAQVEAAAGEWETVRQQVEAFVQRHSRLPRQLPRPQLGLVEGEQELGQWVTLQRRRRDRSSGTALSAAQKAALEATPRWEWGPLRQQVRQRVPWEERRRQVAEFAARQGHLPRQQAGRQQPLLPGERQLGKWCDSQRQRQKGNGKQKPLTADQVAALEGVPLWEWEHHRMESWEGRCGKLAAFVAAEGRFPRPPASRRECLLPGEAELYRWQLHQRWRYKGRGEEALSREQVAALESIPAWEWSATRQNEWQLRYKELVGFVRRCGRLPRATPDLVLQRQEQGGGALEAGERALYHWCARQRRRRSGHVAGLRRALTRDQVAALEAVPGWEWSV